MRVANVPTVIALVFDKHRRANCPSFTPFNSRSLRRVAVLGIAGILRQESAGNLRAFAAVYEPSFLTAFGYRTFAVKRAAVRFDTAAAVAVGSVCAACAAESAAGGRHVHSMILRFFLMIPYRTRQQYVMFKKSAAIPRIFQESLRRRRAFFPASPAGRRSAPYLRS